MRKTYGELFAGVGGASQGLKAAGYHGSWAIDHNQGALGILKANHDIDRIIHCDVCEVDYSKLPKVDLLWASPVCCNYSGANHNRGETKLDRQSAYAIYRASEFTQSLIIENVPAYSNSFAYGEMFNGLERCGFKHLRELTLNAADYGNPSSRRRFYAVFSRSAINSFDVPVSRSNWVDALLEHQDLWVMSEPTKKQAATILENNPHGLPYKPFAIERCGYYKSPKIIRSFEVFPALKSHPFHDGKSPKAGYGKIGSYRSQYDFVFDGASYTLTPQLMGIFMGFPINYNWGESKAQAAAGIGNAVVPKMSRIISKLIQK